MLKRHTLVDLLENGGPLCTLDRVTLVADVADLVGFEHWLFNNLALDPSGLAKYPYRQTFKASFGMYIAFKEKNADVPDLRIDFNPSKIHIDGAGGICELLEPIFFRLKNVRFTRLDLACDYNLDLSHYSFDVKGGSLKRVEYRGRGGDLETLYLGGTTSKKRFRIYNKALESKIDGYTVWRVEAQLRFEDGADDYLLSPLIFEDLLVLEPPQFVGATINERAMIYYLLDHPGELSSLGSKAKAKYRALLRGNPAEILHPSRAFNAQCGNIIAFLNWMKNPHKKSYKDVIF